MESISSIDAKTSLPQLLERVAQGEEFTITRHGKAVARLVPVAVMSQTDVRNVIEEIKAFKNGHALDEDPSGGDRIEDDHGF